MELVVFDLDGTLLNKRSVISDYTSETLKLLSQRDIANFMLALEESDFFAGVKLEQIERNDDATVEETVQGFKIVCSVTMPADKPAAAPDGEDKDGPADAQGGAR